MGCAAEASRFRPRLFPDARDRGSRGGVVAVVTEIRIRYGREDGDAVEKSDEEDEVNQGPGHRSAAPIRYSSRVAGAAGQDSPGRSTRSVRSKHGA